MVEYVNKEVLLNNAVVGKYVVINKDTFDCLLSEQVVSLDRIKEIREEFKAYFEYATDRKQKTAFNACLMVIDSLVAEMEKIGER